MILSVYRRFCALSGALLLSLAALLSGCDPDPATAETSLLNQLNASYEQAMNETNSQAYVFSPGTAEEVQALGKLQNFFSQMSAKSVRERAPDVFSENAYLNDNIVGISGVAAITDYFAHAASQSQTLDVEFVDIARSTTDYFIRWQMTVQADVLADGEPVVTYGTTQFRFNRDGKVLIHKDFWDAATGMYEHLPYAGSFISYVHRKLAGDAYELSFESAP